MEERTFTKKEEIGKEEAKNESRIRTTINKLSALLVDIGKKRRHADFLASPEGKKWTAQMKELEEMNTRDLRLGEKIYALKNREAKRKVALAIFADELVSKYGITDDDPRCTTAMREVEVLCGLGIDPIE